MSSKTKKPEEKRLRPGEYLIEVDDKISALVNKDFLDHSRGKKKVIVGSLTLTMVAQEAYGTHCSNFYQLGRDCPDYAFCFVTPRRMAIADMRNTVVKLAIQGGFDYLYFFDDDTVNDRNVLGRLLPHMKEFNAISASYYVRGYPFTPMVFQWKTDRKTKVKYFQLFNWRNYKKHIDKDGIMRRDVAALGCGCTLFRVEDFKKVSYPWFKTGDNHTEDAWWFHRAHTSIPDYKVGMDFNILCGHLLDPVFVDAVNVDTLRTMYRRLQKVGGLTQ